MGRGAGSILSSLMTESWNSKASPGTDGQDLAYLGWKMVLCLEIHREVNHEAQCQGQEERSFPT